MPSLRAHQDHHPAPKWAAIVPCRLSPVMSSDGDPDGEHGPAGRPRLGDAPELPVLCGHIHQGSRTRIRAYRDLFDSAVKRSGEFSLRWAGPAWVAVAGWLVVVSQWQAREWLVRRAGARG